MNSDTTCMDNLRVSIGIRTEECWRKILWNQENISRQLSTKYK